MKSDEVVGEFQNMVSEVLIRHRSILDCLTKFQESTARVNRSIVKTATNCGCISINASKQHYPAGSSLKECSKYMDSHIKGELCETLLNYRRITTFYLAALCNLLIMTLKS